MQDFDSQPCIFKDEEVEQAVQELFSYPVLIQGMKAFLPAALNEMALNEKDKVKTVSDFQQRIILKILDWIKSISITQLSGSGFEQLDPNERYLFISNHRDIVLDSAFLNTVLFERGFTTSQIAIGDNLMKHRISELIFKINKSFVVRRTGTAVELYKYSVKLSQYITDLITNKKDSVWIAQREGRSKDGNDRTQPGVLKMLSLSNQGDLVSFFQQLNIVPVAISYEFDPCDLLKTQEYLKKNYDPEYKKSFDEDVAYILQGLAGRKGETHFHFGDPLHEALNELEAIANNKKQLEALAQIIDRSIHTNYKLHAINYVACDLLNGSSEYAAFYTPEQKQEYVTYFEDKIRQITPELQAEGRKYLLGIYSNPLINSLLYA